MKELDKEKIQKFYEATDCVWPADDAWHDINQAEISKFISSIQIAPNVVILNAGSGGNHYGLKQKMYHLDVAKNKIEHFPHFFVGTVEDMPFESQMFDLVICVGSVLNYCDPTLVIKEIARVLRPNGCFLLEYETSYGLEYLGSPVFKKSAALGKTSYFGRPHELWLFSQGYIQNLLKSYGLETIHRHNFHILSGLAYHFSKNENGAAKFAFWDGILRHIPLFRKYSSNQILYCRKI